MTESTASSSAQSTPRPDPEDALDIKRHIADTAKSITNGARRSAYGTPEKNFQRIANYWNVFLVNVGILEQDVLSDPEAKGGITPDMVSQMLRHVKDARLCETPDHLDSFIDAVGYTLTQAEAVGVKVPTDE